VIYQQLVQKENKMMPLEKKTDCWEVDPTEGRTTAAWMLIDPHYAGRVLVCGGRTDIEVGDEILDEELARWMTERRQAADAELYLIPIGDEVWFVLTHFYLSTGLLLLTRLPISPGDSRALAESGTLGQVIIYPTIMEGMARERDLDLRQTRLWWKRIVSCLPMPIFPENEVEEMDRLLRAAAALNGIRVDRSELPLSGTASDEIAIGQQDLFMLSIMLLSALFALRQNGILRISPRYEQIEEGMSLTLRAKRIDPDGMLEESAEISLCRELAERNGQIFACSVQQDATLVTLCAVRKDFALLGVKTDPEIP
jgi:hypothetical protein